VTSSLEGIVKHDNRLAVLACLVEGEPLAAPRLSAETGLSMTAIRYHVTLLVSCDLIEEDVDLGGEPRYRASLDEHPAWVREAVERYKRDG
jgi:DNA-binding transcriptional ArsR family regulator